MISAVSATFFGDFSGCFAVVGELFCRFQRFQLLFSGFFPAVSLGLGSCFVDFSSFSYFFGDFSGCFAGFGELFCGFQRFQLLFSRIFPAFGLDLRRGHWNKTKREQSDYDDFFIASKEAQKQFDNAESIVAAIIEYMHKNNSGTIV